MSVVISDAWRQRFGGTARLYGEKALQLFADAHICVVGIGGVGSWAAEALARTGIGDNGQHFCHGNGKPYTQQVKILGQEQDTSTDTNEGAQGGNQCGKHPVGKGSEKCRSEDIHAAEQEVPCADFIPI